MKRTIKTAILTIVFLFMTFQQAILSYCSWSPLSYVDELCMVLCVLFVILAMLRHPVDLLKPEKVMICMILIFLGMGLISSFTSGYRTIFLTASDAMICCKFIVFYLAVRVLLKGEDTLHLVKWISVFCRISAVVMALLTVHDMVFSKWFPVFDVRYGINAVQLFFPHPTYLSFACFTLMVPLMLSLGFKSIKKRRDVIYIAILLALAALSLRSKAIAGAACSVLIGILYALLKNRSKGFFIGAGGIMAAALGWKSVMDYYGSDTTVGVRQRMMNDSVSIANGHFPLGTGFGTFGSAIAADHYSPVYTLLGYEGIWGMSSTRSDYLCDTFWPIVIAQTGWIGTAVFTVLVFCFVILAFKSLKTNRYIAWALLTVIIYELISSTAETAFFNPASSMMFVVFAFGINLMMHERGEG